MRLSKQLYCLGFSIALNGAVLHAQVSGCTDPLAVNYNSTATLNDGSCIYPSTQINVSATTILPDLLKEASGLMWHSGFLWTHNDNNNVALYAVDTASMTVSNTVNLPILPGDWEAVEKDESYVYIGDVGNNASGNRNDLKIYRFQLAELQNSSQQIDTIAFSYADQTDFSDQGFNNCDLDCEAFVVGPDSIYLFTKQWQSGQTTVYGIPKLPGTYLAVPLFTLQVEGLITDATRLEGQQAVVLCGYSMLLQPFVYLLYDFPNWRFDLGNKRKIELNLPLHQIEGITQIDGPEFFLANEQFTSGPSDIPQQIHRLDLQEFLQNYLNNLPEKQRRINNYRFFPNPVKEELFVQAPVPASLQILNLFGQKVSELTVSEGMNRFSLNSLKPGVYFILTTTETTPVKLVVH